jgi:hypothetical protein
LRHSRAQQTRPIERSGRSVGDGAIDQRSRGVHLAFRRYAETVEVQLFRSVPGGFQQFGSLTQSVPMNPKNGTTDFAFSYTFTADDATIGKVTFRAVAVISGARDALPADNEAIAPPTKVSR